MTKIRVGLRSGKGITIDIQKPFDYITTKDIQEKIGNKTIIGWCKLDLDK